MYDEHWGLTGRPFQLTPDPRFWFETATHRKAMAYLGYGLVQGEGFIVITGDIGAGKTTLVGHLLDTLDRQRLNPLKIVSTAIEAEDLLRIVAGQLGIETAGLPKAQLLTAIERGLHAVARTGRRTLLVVDEAQALPVSALEELRMLSNFQAGGHALLQIVLLGQPEFRDRLHGSARLEQLRQRVIAIHHLDPMEAHEVADYIAHRLSVVGWRGRPDFAEDAFAAFYQGSGGVPRRLNLLAGRVMLHAAIENLALIDAHTVRMVLRDLHADLPMMALDREPLPMAAADVPEPAVAMPLPRPEPEPQEPQPIVRPEVSGSVRNDEGEAAADPVAAEPGVEEPSAAPPFGHRGFDPAAARSQPVSVAESPMPEPLRDEAVEEVAVVEPAPPTADDDSAELTARVAVLEARVEAQDAALRRVLTLLVDWVEADELRGAAPPVPSPASVPSAPVAPVPVSVPIRGAATWNDAA